MQKKYAFLLMGSDFDPERQQAVFETDRFVHYLCTVRDRAEARKKVQELAAAGVGVIELCGAFGADFAKELIALTGNRVGIVPALRFPEQEELIKGFFA